MESQSRLPARGRERPVLAAVAAEISPASARDARVAAAQCQAYTIDAVAALGFDYRAMVFRNDR